MTNDPSIDRLTPGPRMSQAVRHGGVVYLAGQVALRAPGASVAEQTRDILARIDELLEQAGSARNRMLNATIWLTSMGDFAEMNAVWDAWVPKDATPARATVESPRLAAPEYKVEIAVIAAV